MPRVSRTRSACCALLLSALAIGSPGCSDPEVGTIKAEPAGAAGDPKAEGRFKESTPPAKKPGADEGISTR